MSASYSIRLFSPAGIFLGILPVATMELARRDNEIGTLGLTLPSTNLASFIRKDYILEVWRSPDFQPAYMEGGGTFWLVERVRRARSGPLETVEVVAADALKILRRRVVADEPDTAYTNKIGFSDDLMKEIILEQFSTGATDADRDISFWLSIDSSSSAGPIVGGDISKKNVYDVLADFANQSYQAGTRVIFDLLSASFGKSRFRTWPNYRGVNHGSGSPNPILVSLEAGNLTDPEMILDYSEEYNFVYAGGQGEADIRIIKEALDATRIAAGPYARTEIFLDVNSPDPDMVQRAANSALTAGRPRLLFTGKLIETYSLRYGIHYNWGDLVQVSYAGISMNCYLDTLHISYNKDSGEQVESILHGEAIL